MNTAAVHATRTGSDFVQKKPRYVFLALALFLLPFHRNLLGWNLLPAAPIVTAFASVYLKVSDAALLLSLCLFILSEKGAFFRVPLRFLIVLIPTLLLAAFAMVSLINARLPLLALVLALRLLGMAGLVLCLIHTPPAWITGPLIASGVVNALLGMAQYGNRGSVGLGLLGEGSYNLSMPGIAVVAAEGEHLFRALGFAAHPNNLAPYLIAALLLLSALALSHYPNEAWGEMAGAAVLASGLALTYSRASWVGLAMAASIPVLGTWINREHRHTLINLRHGVLAIGLAFLTFGVLQSRQIASRFGFFGVEDGATSSETDRLLLLEDAYQLIRVHPFTGIGGYNFSAESARTLEITPVYAHDFLWQPVHNTMVLVASELGIFAVPAWLVLMLAPSLWALRPRHHSPLTPWTLAWIGLALFLAWDGLFSHFEWSLPEGMGLFWITATMNIRSRDPVQSSEQSTEQFHPIEKVAVRLGLIVLGLFGGLILLEAGSFLALKGWESRPVPGSVALESQWISRGHPTPWQEEIGWDVPANAVIRYTMPGVYDTLYVTNQGGYRGALLPYQKPPGSFRVLIVGDSYIEAYQVQQEQTFGALLQQEIANSGLDIEVLSMGRSGWGTIHEALYYQIDGHLYHPDLVIYLFSWNDPSDNYPEYYWPDDPYRNRRNYLLEEDQIISQPADRQDESIRRKLLALLRGLPTDIQRGSYSLRLLLNHLDTSEELVYSASGNPVPEICRADPSDALDLAWERTRQSMRIWQAQVQAGGAVFTMLVLPDGQYPCAAEQLTHARLREGELRALVTENGGMVLDPTEFVNTSLSDRGLPSSALQVVPGIDYHFSPLAHQLMADFLVRWLQDRQTLPAH